MRFLREKNRSGRWSSFVNCIYRGLSLALCAQVPGFPELRKSLLRLAPRHVVIVSYFASRFSDVGNAFHTATGFLVICVLKYLPLACLPELQAFLKM
jgi:hypothetical protein